jgi:hypothetical protein
MTNSTTNTDTEDLKKWQEEIDKVKDDDIVQVGMPLKHYLQECVLACKQFEGNKDALTQGGMDFTVVSSIPSLVNATRELFSRQSMVTFPNAASKKAWENGKEQADDLLYDLKAAMDYAFRDNPELLAQVSVIREGSSNPDMIQDLSDAAVLARTNSSLLEDAKYDMSNVDRAAELAKELSDLLAQATYDRSTAPENSVARNKALTLLKKKIDDLNKQARYIMRTDKKNASSFVISPPRRKHAKKEEPVPEAVPATA